jgi:hypothetical protein
MYRGSHIRILKSTVPAPGAFLRLSCLIFMALFCATNSSAQTVLVGNQAIEANLDSNATGLAEAFPVTATASGTVGSINFFLDESSAATKIYVGIYKDSSGKPGSLLTQGSGTQFYPGTWNSITVTAASLTSGTAYWIAILGTTGSKPYFYDRSTTACHSQTSSQTNLTSLPSTWSTGTTWNTCYISAYAVSSTLPTTVMIGDQAVEAYLDKNPAGRAEAFPATANTTGSVGTIALYLDPTSGTGPVSVGLYADNSGHPGTLLGQGTTTSPVAGTWNQVSIASSSITAGAHYWIAVLGTQATSPYFRDRQTTVCHSETTPQSTLTSLPATWSTGTVWNTCYISAYGLAATGSPALSISPTSLSFAAIQGGANPASANLTVTNTGTGTLNFTDSTDQSWLSATPTSGAAPKTLQVSASVGSLTPGTYTGHVTVTATGAQNSPQLATVTFTVSPFVPPSVSATVSPAPNANGWNNANVTVTFTCTAGSYPVQTCPSPIVVSTEGANQSTCGHAVDTQGNSSLQACANVSLDKTTPTITASVSPAPVGGINYGSATVTFTCSDALSGVATCPSPITDTTIGSNQNISGTATDKAGNSKTASVTLNIQPTTLPTVVATLSPAPNANGWNNANVTVTFTCTAGSYPVQTCPSPIVVSTEGTNQSICGHAVDTQGNSSLTVCAKVSLDKTPPTITAAVSPAPIGGINYGSATVTFTCSDALSGVATCPSPITDTTIGSNQNISGTATDKAGNANSASVTLNIQPTVLPTIVATPSPAPNTAGWNNANITVTFTCTAGSYPVQTCPSPIVVSAEGSNQSICGHAVDTQGNSSVPACANVSLDKTPPTITAAVTPAPVSGINYGSATVTFTCSDVLSGVSTCPTPVTITTIGSNQNISGTATDKAGNANSASVTLNIQALVLPITVATSSPAPNSNGWNNANVTVTFTCTAGSYPVQTCPSPISVSTEGANQSTCGHAVDTLGNSSLSVCDNVSIDKTPPTITASAFPAPNAAGWNTTSVTVSFACGDALSGIVTCPSPQTVTTAGANQIVKGSVTDLAGNTASTQVTLNISETPPQIIAVVAPPPNGAGWNSTNLTVSFTCTAGAAPITTCPSPQVITTEGANIPVTGTVTDAAGVTATATVVIKLDKTPPTIIPNLSPAPNASGWETAPVTVSFTCSDSLSGVAVCPSSTVISSDGANQPVSGTATDVAGNSATATATVNLEQALPTISASASPAANSYGWNNTGVTVTFTCNKSVSTIVSCSSPQTVSAQGIGQVITGTVTDQAGRQSTTSVTLNIDETPPAILQFTGPSQLSPGQSGTASLSVSDIAPVASVVFQLNGSPVGTVLAPPYTVSVIAPSNAISGSTLTLTAVVTDVAGNASSANIGIKVASSGVVVGEVLSDATGLPLAGASLQVVGQTGQSMTSDSEGRYSIPVTSSQLFLSVSRPGNSGSGIPAMVTIERQVSVQSGVGTVPVDARLTALAAPTVISGSGGTVGTGPVTVTVPAGGTTTSFNLTPLSQQGLPGLLPLGWSPVAAFDLQANASTSAALSANFTGLPTGTLYFVSYSYNVHAWNMVTPNLTASNGSLTVSLPSTGDYALVVPDAGNTSLQIPAAGQPLTGVPMVALPTTATGTGSPSPANLAPAGGTSLVTLAVQSATAVPSGTVIQSEVTEKYTLTSGQLVSDEPRYEDLLLYQYPAPSSGSIVGATFPVTPSQTFQPSQLSSGDLHLDILSGRESVRGQTGGSDPVAVNSGDATLTIAAGSLPQNTAIAVDPEGIDTFLPATSTLVPLSEYNVDLSGETLSTSAQLSVGTAGAAPGSNVLIAQIQRVGGVPFLVVVGTAQVTTTNIVSQVMPGLPGITEDGEYVFYQLNLSTGFVSGTVSASSGPVAAMVQTDALPFVAFSTANGSYTIAAVAGTVNLTASIPSTALSGTATAQVIAGQTASVNLTVVGQVESTTITPANGAVGVPLTAEIDVVAADGFNPATVTSSSVVLTAAGTTTPVTLRFVYSAGNTRLAIFPQVALQPSTLYTFQASGLANALGGLISVPTISFTTLAIIPPAYNTKSLVFAMPDQNGNVAISAPANSFPAGSTILIVDETNGVVESLTVFNDGSVTGQMPATINDILQVTLTDPAGNKTTFTISQFVAADGTTAIGPGGGTVVGPGNTGIIIPAGALPQGVTFQLTQLDQTAFPTLPTWTGVNFGSGLRIHDPAMPTFKKEAKLAFPVPAGAPTNAFYYVYRRLMDQNGNPYFETIDEAFVQGTGASAQVVTASPPFCGYHNSFGNFKIQADSPPLPITMEDQDYFVMWDATAQQGPSGFASTGLVVGLAQQTVPAVIGISPATTQPAQGTVTISLDQFPNQVAIYDGTCATFTLFDPHLGGGPRNITASSGATTLHTAVDEVDGAQVDDGLYAIYAGLEDLYKNIGRVNFLFPPAILPPPPPAINVQVFTLNQYGHRVPAGGILQTGTNVVIAFQSGLTVQSASVSGSQQDVETPDSTDQEVLDGLPEQTLLSARVKNLYPLGAPGAYTITATGVDPISLTVTTASQSILVVAAGGSNTSTFTCTAAPAPADPTAGCTLPQVVNIAPTNLATSISPAVFPVVTFNEPVTNISSANVALTVANVPSNPASQISSVVPVVLVGVRVPNPNNPNQSPIADPVQPSDVITSLTIEPLDGLGYSETYNLTLNATAGSCLNANKNPEPPTLPTTLIVDQNQSPTGPLCLAAYGVASQPYQFTTFGPQDLGGVASQYEVLTRPVVIGNTAYAGEYLSSAISGLGMFDVIDPTHPKDLLPGASFVGRAIDVAGQAQSPVTGAGLVAVSSGTAVDNTIPANVWLYDVSSPTKPNRVGAVSVTSDTSFGIALRLFMKDEYLYASTFEQGLQVIDLGQAIAEYSQTSAAQFGQAVSTAGDGFAMDAIVNTIPIPLVTGGQATMFDLKADNFATNGGSTQTLVVAAGQLPFVMVDPTLSGSLAILYPPNTGGTFSTNPVQSLTMTSSDGKTKSLLCYGTAVDIGTIAVAGSGGSSTSEHIAVVVGNGITGPVAQATGCPIVGQPPPLPVVPVLAVVNVSTAYTPGGSFTPQLVGFLQLPTTGTDITLSGTTALISTGSNILLVSLQNPAQPISAGQITGNFGNWLAVNSSGLIVGSSNSPGGGVQVSSLGITGTVSATPDVMLVDTNSNSVDNIQFQYQINGDLAQVVSATMDIQDQDGNAVTSIPVPVQAQGTVTLASGLAVTPTPVEMTLMVVNSDGTMSAPISVSPEVGGGAAPTPVISSISPAAVVVGSGSITITVTGRNFLPSTLAQISQTLDLSADNLQSAQYVSSTQVKLTLTSDYFTQLATWNIYLSNLYNLSNVVQLLVVQPGAPLAPVLTSVSPNQLPSSAGPIDATITLQGENFIVGDTVVANTFSANPVTYTVLSPTQISVDVPANWQTFPLSSEFYVYSAAFPYLQSQQLGFQVQNSLNVPLPATEPQISVVNDGYVVLANSASVTPTTVSITGNSFDSAPTLLAVVDGQETTINPSQVTGTSMQAQIPPAIWESMNLQAQLKVTLRGTITPGKGLLLGTATLPKQRMKFQNAQNGNIIDGFHSHHFTKIKTPTKKNPEEAFLAVPPGGSNNVLAQLPDRHYLQPGVTVTYDGGPFLLSVPPATGTPPAPVQIFQAQAYRTTLKVQGLASVPGGLALNTLYPMEAFKTQVINGQSNSVKIGALGLQSMPARPFTVAIYFVGQGDPTTNAQPTLIPARAKRDITWLQNKLNAIWAQANVTFTVQPPGAATAPSDPPGYVYHITKVLYDTIGVNGNPPADNALEAWSTEPRTEMNAIVSAIPIQPNTINLYFIRSFDSTSKANGLLGEAMPPLGTHAVFVSDTSGDGADLAQTVAHEIGHTLGLQHNADLVGNACTGQNNPFIDYADGDSDATDESKPLMWCSRATDRLHLGSPAWFQLNSANPLLPQ